MRRRSVVCALAATAAFLGMQPAAGAVPVSASLTSVNGSGTFDDTLACGVGDGPSWGYRYTGLSAPASGPLGGEWSGTIEVHRSGPTTGFIPPGTGRIGIDNPSRGAIFLEFGGGNCTSPTLTLAGPSDEPTASGVLPFSITGGTGAYRLLTGTGTASLTAALTKGADNAAAIDLNGNLSALQPNLTIGTPSARWPRIVDYLNRRISVFVPVTNAGPASSTGDAFNVRLTSVTISGGASAGPSSAVSRLNAGGGTTFGMSASPVNAGATYTITVTVAADDALGGAVAPVTATRTFKAPLTPLN